MAVYTPAFGLCSAPASFYRLMEAVLRGLTYDSCLVYIDDVIVVGRSFQEHLLDSRKLFLLFGEAQQKLKFGTWGILRHLRGYCRPGKVESCEGMGNSKE
jgi:hypothetical protein